MSEWQPIETAPKDGTKILVGRFTGKEGHLHEGRIAVDWYRSAGIGAGFTGFGKFNNRHWPATHWQPLPAPPEMS